MIFRTYSQSVALSLLTVALSIGPVAAQEQEGKRRDNSGRQLAMVVPAPPPAVARPLAAIPVGLQRKAAEMTPQVKETVEKGAVIVQNVSNIAVKRAGDVVVWVSTMWRELNDTPTITPVHEFSAPSPPASAMHPMDADRGSRTLYFTNEHRLKTVVGQ
jgi:hypothetical protein